MKSPALRLIVVALGLAAGSALAQGYGYGPGAGPCWGDGEGFGPGAGYGAGMGYGPGMMGGGYGRGMGYGRGGGYGPGSGYGPGAGANLTDEQRAKAAALQEKFRESNWKAMGEMQKERFKLGELYSAAKPDAKAIAEQEKKVDALREQLFKARSEHRREMQALLGRPS